ncbi:GNAT family N-acetyltransferase [Streptomyces somaliensis]|uniref:GNAT family N-acetyltransferase n=1 Tax=Streptomyces somaliensis TaxID=78355 RepID=UPI0020CE13A6|nr:GNAT family N-acetyltransferase [Streptomyces somaliensis]MCP9943604.1 GNAT family N-acetyltransferase [Streptomyces somaliensis]MCP9963147.1 GNAT family N-acetyltransferase [Streptomyces somaliensis]MCP9975994.1 GNAT family N-acetyltransferase [Streptomyces somaliensis]
MDDAEVLALFDRRMRREAPPDGPGCRVERAGEVVRQTGPAEEWNGVLWSGLTAATADRAIREQIRHYTALGREFEWKLYEHDRPDDLGERLRAAGFAAGPREALMVAATSRIAAVAAAPPAGVELLPVTDAAGVDLVAEVHDRAFGTDGSRLRRRLLRQLAERPGTLVAVVAVADGGPVGSARVELVPGTGFAGLWGGGTVPEWRGRGVYRALVAHRARIAAERGFSRLQVDASDDSRPVLERLGFAVLSTTTPYDYRPDATTG